MDRSTKGAKKLLLHVGMGKTGTSSIQKALELSSAKLRAEGVNYLGGSFKIVGTSLAEKAGSFFSLDADEISKFSFEVEAYIKEQEGINLHILSSETLLDKYNGLKRFAEILETKGVEVSIIIFVRSPDEWLPSAYSQWGLYHKTYNGKIKDFKTFSPGWMKRYGDVVSWCENFPGRVSVHEYSKNTDAVKRFSDLAGINICPLPDRVLERLEKIELVARAAFNNNKHGNVLPMVFDRAMLRGGKVEATNLYEMYKMISSTDGMEGIIEGEKDTIARIREVCGIDLSSSPSSSEGDLMSSDEFYKKLFDYSMQILMRAPRKIALTFPPG